MTTTYSEDDNLNLLRGAIAAHDNDASLWPPESVEYARNLFIRARGSIPTLDRIVQEIGIKCAEELLPKILDQRKFKNQLLGYRSPCHYCASDIELVGYEFALMKVDESKLSFGATAATAAVSAVTLPLLGAGALRLPGRSRSGQALHLRLVACKLCRKSKGNIFGLFILDQQRAAAHPLWQLLHEHGFTKFLEADEMPDEFKYDIGRDL